MNRPGPISRLALALGALNLVLLVLRIPASLVGLGWLTTVFVLISSPLGVLCAVIARGRERDGASREAGNRAVLWSGGALAGHLVMLVVFGP